MKKPAKPRPPKKPAPFPPKLDVRKVELKHDFEVVHRHPNDCFDLPPNRA